MLFGKVGSCAARAASPHLPADEDLRPGLRCRKVQNAYKIAQCEHIKLVAKRVGSHQPTVDPSLSLDGFMAFVLGAGSQVNRVSAIPHPSTSRCLHPPPQTLRIPPSTSHHPSYHPSAFHLPPPTFHPLPNRASTFHLPLCPVHIPPCSLPPPSTFRPSPSTFHILVCRPPPTSVRPSTLHLPPSVASTQAAQSTFATLLFVHPAPFAILPPAPPVPFTPLPRRIALALMKRATRPPWTYSLRLSILPKSEQKRRFQGWHLC